jgi:SAM-dependent methyltransferase
MPGRGRGRRRAEVAAVVLDAERLPLAARRADAIVAAELIDLLAAPERFLAAAANALRPRGRLLLATPDPALGGDDGGRLRSLLTGGGWRIVAHHRAVPWVRPHTARHYQVYFADVIAAER